MSDDCEHPEDRTTKTVLLTGATGYVGGRLLALLEARGVRLRCLARAPANLDHRTAPDTEVVQGDLLEPETLADAMRGVDTAYYLVHSMNSAGDFRKEDQEAARNFAIAAKAAGVNRIVYLGGLGEEQADLSKHLKSRHEVGDILREESGATVIEFRASIVIGSGSLSFELVRALVRRLPVMICPRWVAIRTQPIAIEDLLDYLLAALDYETAESRIFEIGGPEQVSYGQIMQEYARQRGLRRWLISVPVLTPRLSSLWLGLVTPIYARVGRKLIDGLRNPTVVQDTAALREFPIKPRGLSEAIARALATEDNDFAETRWSDALSSSRGVRDWGGRHFGSRIVDSHTAETTAPPAAAFEPIRSIGGRRGWYYANGLWTLRAWLDLLFGGIGSRRGRRDPHNLRVGDVLDWWRVEQIEPDRRLLLHAEMKVPGRAWLEFEVDPTGDGSTIRQTAIFDPSGLFGLAYWYGLYPLHALIFRGMLRAIVKQAESGEATDPSTETRRDSLKVENSQHTSVG